MSRMLMATGVMVLAFGIARYIGAESPSRSWTFETDAPESPPSGLAFARTDGGAMGRWIVREVTDAPSGKHVLVQVDEDATGRYPVAVADEPALRDLRLSVKCKPLSGRVDQACGLVFRYGDENNYYVTRANALEWNVRLYAVKKGRRQEVASWNGDVPRDRWSELRVEARGDHLVIHWNNEKAIDAHDTAFAEAGKVGLWTKADSVTAFDDLAVAPADGGGGKKP
jgi:hypothetical protein